MAKSKRQRPTGREHCTDEQWEALGNLIMLTKHLREKHADLLKGVRAS